MRHYVQLKDGVVFAAHQSTSEVDDSGPNVWAVDEDGSDKVGKLYDNGNFSDAPVIKYAKLDEDGTIISIEKTVYSSEVGDNLVISNPDVKVLWKWNGSDFIAPVVVEPVEMVPLEITVPPVPEVVDETTPE
jgi:hypothetical protein